MASPVVAGGAAVLLAYMPELKPDQIIESLVKSSNPSTANGFTDQSQAGGVIDLKKQQNMPILISIMVKDLQVLLSPQSVKPTKSNP